MKRLKDLREDHDLTQSDVARVLNISQQYYQRYEAGKNEMPLRHCVTLAKFYGVSLDYLVGVSSVPCLEKAEQNPTAKKYARLIEKWDEADPKTKEIVKMLLSL